LGLNNAGASTLGAKAADQSDDKPPANPSANPSADPKGKI
jgi:hypothetical protein